MISPYIYDATELLKISLRDLDEVIEASELSKRPHHTLYELREELTVIDSHLYQHVNSLLLEKEDLPLELPSVSKRSLGSSVNLLRSLEQKTSPKQSHCERDLPQVYYPKRSATGSLLFRLVVALQLCTVRIDDARSVLVGSRKNNGAGSAVALTGSEFCELSIIGGITYTVASAFAFQKYIPLKLGRLCSNQEWLPTVAMGAKVAASILCAYVAKRSWGTLWMARKLVRTIEELEDWNSQWCVVQSTTSDSPATVEKGSLDAVRSQRLVEYALRETPKVSLWQSQGELRFLMLKRAMDVFYASVGTAMQVTQSPIESDPTTWQMTVATAAVASFYTIIGARRRAEAATSSSESARKLIHHAWGMVSLPALKNISLQASKLLKGAAVADRMEIANVPCFVLSVQPAPELAAATKRFHRKHGNKNTVHTLLTICEEKEEHHQGSSFGSKPFANSSARYRQRDVILHLTGGGFFAHIIASDLPFLMDWSSSTGAVVICPEYDLLPEHAFPDALQQVESVYKALNCDEGTHALGFEATRIVLTGESAGGNLAAALCTKLCMDKDGISTCLSDGDAASTGQSNASEHPSESVDTTPELPCALVLSCPVLNLSLELSYSRVIGNQDPVLPSGLISAISDAYIRDGHGYSKRDPLVSPFFATDAVLARFPSTLVFASSHDPLLDDAVVLNQRLRSLGVESDLRVAHNLPHAYLGLGTAGFPEAREVQRQLIEWLNFQLTRDLELSID